MLMDGKLEELLVYWKIELNNMFIVMLKLKKR